MSAVESNKVIITRYLGSAITVVGTIFYHLYQGDYFNTALFLMLFWFFVNGVWALATGHFFWPGGGRAPRALLVGRFARVLGVILLLPILLLIVLLLDL